MQWKISSCRKTCTGRKSYRWCMGSSPTSSSILCSRISSKLFLKTCNFWLQEQMQNALAVMLRFDAHLYFSAVILSIISFRIRMKVPWQNWLLVTVSIGFPKTISKSSTDMLTTWKIDRIDRSVRFSSRQFVFVSFVGETYWHTYIVHKIRPIVLKVA